MAMIFKSDKDGNSIYAGNVLNGCIFKDDGTGAVPGKGTYVGNYILYDTPKGDRWLYKTDGVVFRDQGEPQPGKGTQCGTIVGQIYESSIFRDGAEIMGVTHTREIFLFGEPGHSVTLGYGTEGSVEEIAAGAWVLIYNK